ncbi:MAG: hypothetical protein QS98_C0004G0018 [archaeon GW2011_AR3]|nr:MAG: hypothetical protein QS98_C0004G0018 [archaeon GW2011_AR3]MBS3109572.1 CDP-glycerol glycerophosphotransferase family protein [Candidatus Woesearchaeota archaeon]
MPEAKKIPVCILVHDMAGLDTLNRMVQDGKIKIQSSKIIFWDASLLNSFNNLGFNPGIKVEHIEKYVKKTDFAAMRHKIIDLIKIFPHKKILQDKSFIELTEFNGYSMWWFIRQGFYAHMVVSLKEFSVLETVVRNLKMKKMLLLTGSVTFLGLASNVAKKYNIQLDGKLSEDANHAAGKSAGMFGNIGPGISNASARLIRIIQGFIRFNFIKRETGKKNFLVFTQAHVWTNLGAGLRGDINSYTILRKIMSNKNYRAVVLDYATNTGSAWQAIREKKYPFLPVEYFIFSSYFDRRIQSKISAYQDKLRQVWPGLENSQPLRKSLKYGYLDLFSILKPQISKYFTSNFDSLSSAARNLAIMDKIISENKIDCTICSDENGTSRSIVFASHMNGVPSIGIQHGIIHKFHISYNYGNSDVHSTKSNGNAIKKRNNCILPTKTAVYGRHFRDLLLKLGNYSPDMVEVTGQPRTDLIFENKRNYSRPKLFKQLGLDQNRKLVVYAAQPHKDETESIVALTELVQCIRKMKDVQMLIKLHPNDNWNFYEKILADLDYTCAIIREIDLYELFSAADLLISINSTVMLESLLMDVPVIQLNLREQFDFLSELKGKAFKQVTDKSTLHSSIREYLFDKNSMQKLSKMRREYLSRYFLPVDGKASSRFMNIVNGVIK